MNSMLYISACSMVYCILLALQVFKDKQKTVGKKLLRYLIISNFISLSLEVLGFAIGGKYEDNALMTDISLRFMLINSVLWMTIFFVFTYNISRDSKDKKTFDKKILPVYLLGFVFIGLTILLPIKYGMRNGEIAYTYGKAVDATFLHAILIYGLSLISMFKGIKRVKATNYAFLFALISLGAFSFSIQSTYPELTLSSTVCTLINYIIYFTIQSNTYNKVVDDNKKGDK